MGVLPVKCNKIHNKRSDNTDFVMCGSHKEAMKHLLCICQDETIKNLKHDKIVQELTLWGKIAASKSEITSVEINQQLDRDIIRKPDLLYTYRCNTKTHQTSVEVTVMMDNAMKRARLHIYDKYKTIIDDHAKTNTGVKAAFKIFAFRALCDIPKKFESIPAEIMPHATTNWLITLITL